MEIAGLLVALLALGLTLWQGWLTRTHNRRSVRPHLDWRTHTARSDSGVSFRFLIRNTGIGPAIVRRRCFYLDGAPYSSPNNTPIEEIVEQCLLTKVCGV